MRLSNILLANFHYNNFVAITIHIINMVIKIYNYMLNIEIQSNI